MNGKKIIVTLSFIILFSLISGCLDGAVPSDIDQSLVGTWESGVVNGYYIHQKILEADGSFTGRWLYTGSRGVYSEVSGTWTADGYILTTITTHTDTYSYSFIDSDTMYLQWDSESRTYYKQ